MRGLASKISLSVAEKATFVPCIYEVMDWIIDDEKVNVPIAAGSFLLGVTVGAIDMIIERKHAQQDTIEHILQNNTPESLMYVDLSLDTHNK